MGRDHFKQRLDEELDEEHRNLVSEVDENLEPFVGEFGRVTYFYMLIGGKVVPLFQPGSIMFVSGIQENSELSTKIDGEHMNGGILRVRGAVFLARFIGSLVLAYNDLCEQHGVNMHKINNDIYVQALEQTLYEFCIEDMLSYGRLIVIKKILLKLAEVEKYDLKLLSLF